MSRQWLQRELEELAEDWLNNTSLRPKARLQRMTEFHPGHSVEEVEEALKLVGIDPAKEPTKPAPAPEKKLTRAEQKAAMAKLEAGIPTEEVAQIYGVPVDVAENLARRARAKAIREPGPVQTVRKGEAMPGTPAVKGKKKRHRHDQETIAAVVRDVMAGDTYALVSERYGVPIGSITGWVKKERDRQRSTPAEKENECMKNEKTAVAAEMTETNQEPMAEPVSSAASDGDAVTSHCHQAEDAAQPAEPQDAAPTSSEPQSKATRYTRYFTGVVSVDSSGCIKLDGKDLGKAVAAAFGLSGSDAYVFAGRLDLALSDCSVDKEDVEHGRE